MYVFFFFLFRFNFFPFSCGRYFDLICLQLRVIRAFRSTLEDLEERRSVHSLHSLRSSRSHTGIIGTAGSGSNNPGLYAQTTVNANLLAPSRAYAAQSSAATVPLADISYIDEDAGGEAAAATNGNASKRRTPAHSHETRI